MAPQAHRHPKRNDALAGIGLMVSAMVCLSSLDATVKWLGGAGYPVPQVIFVRSLIGLIPIVIFIACQGGAAALATRRPRMHAMRLLFICSGAFAFFWALPRLPLAEATTIAFSTPLFVTVIATLFLGEAVGPHRWGAIAVGFLGVLIVLRPGTGVLQPAAFVVLFAALNYAAMMISARALSDTETAESLIFWTNAGMIPVAGVLVPWNWVAPDATAWAVFAAAGIVGGIGQTLLVLAFRRAEGPVIAPFQYVSLITATFYGWLVWDSLPDAWTLAGAAVIVGAGIYIIRREKLARSRATAESQSPGAG